MAKEAKLIREENGIEVRESFAGITAYLGRSRIRVADVVRVHRMVQEQEPGVESIESVFPHVPADQIQAALAYWKNHPREIEELIAEEDAIITQMSAPR